MPHNQRVSEWQVFRRCLAIIRRVQQGPCDWQTLMQAVKAAEGDDAYGSAAEPAQRKAFYRDLDSIRQRLDIDLRADPRTKLYAIRRLDRPLLDLPDESLKTIAWLAQTFAPGSPHHREVQDFLEQVRLYLPPERRAAIEQQRTRIVLELGQQDDDRLDPQVVLKLQEALSRRRQVEFDYLSPQSDTGQPRRHVVDIFEPPRFEPTLGHYYVWGWCHYNVGQGQRYEPQEYISYRLGRISNVKLLPSRLPPGPPVAKKYRVVYRLSAEIARQGVTRRRWIDIETVDPQPDESVIVSGATNNLFFALQELMHYRHHCQLLGGTELLGKMRDTVRKMAEIYQTDE